MTRNKDKIRYKAFSFRLDDRTYKMLKELRDKEQISWNRLIYKIITNYVHKEFREDD